MINIRLNQNRVKNATKFARRVYDFVDKVTSEASKSSDKMRERINYLNSKDIEMSRLLTAGIGLSGEVGEFNEIIKKILFQEKTFDVVAHEHMKRRIGRYNVVRDTSLSSAEG